MAAAEPVSGNVARSWLGVKWPEWARQVLLVQLAVAFVLQLLIAYDNLSKYALDVPGALTVLFWMSSAAITSVALAAVMTRRPWFAGPLLISEMMILLSACYVLWADFTSPYPDVWTRVVAASLLLVAGPAVPPLFTRLTQLPGNVWTAGLALVSTLGITQFMVENIILPNRSAPVMDLQASLQEVGRSAGVAHVRGSVGYKNVGKATAWLPQVLATVTAFTGTPGTTAPLDAAEVLNTLDPLLLDGIAYQRALPQGASKGVVWLEDLAPFASTVPPGVSGTREFLIDLPLEQVRGLELRVDLTALTNTQGRKAVTCQDVTSSESPDFLAKYRHAVVGDGWVESCLRVPIQSGNTVRALTDDNTSVYFGYAFVAPGPELTGSYVSYQSEGDTTNPTDLQRAAERADRRHRSSVLTNIAALALPLDGAPGK